MTDEILVEINYENQKICVSDKNRINLKDLIKISAEKFNIDKNSEKNIFFSYIDEEGDINKIEKDEDIYNISKKQENSEKYISTLDLIIVPFEENNYNNDMSDSQSKTEKELKDLEKINNEKDLKIKELEEIIEKMKTEHSEKINKIKSEKNLENINSVKITDINSQVTNENNGENVIKNEISKIEKVIINLFNKEKNNFLSQIENIKSEIISEIKEEFKNNNSNDSKNIDDIYSNISEINSNLNDYSNIINNIKNDLYSINKRVIQIEKKDKENKENNIENKENNLENNNIINNNPIIYQNMPLMPANKFYKCTNCNLCFVLNECFDPKENTYYEGHSLQLQESNLTKNEDNIEQNEDINKQIKNKDNNNINIIDNYINDKNKNEKEYNQNDGKIKDLNNKNEEEDDYKEEMEFNEILKYYFYNKEGKIKFDIPTDNELIPVKNFYKSLFEKGRDFSYIRQCQNKYIEYVLDPQIRSLTLKNKNIINNRLDKIRNILNIYNPGKKKQKYKQNHNIK